MGDLGFPTEDLHLINSRPCWAYLKHALGRESLAEKSLSQAFSASNVGVGQLHIPQTVQNLLMWVTIGELLWR